MILQFALLSPSVANEKYEEKTFTEQLSSLLTMQIVDQVDQLRERERERDVRPEVLLLRTNLSLSLR